jgi:hypothetical protein
LGEIFESIKDIYKTTKKSSLDSKKEVQINKLDENITNEKSSNSKLNRQSNEGIMSGESSLNYINKYSDHKN